MRSHDQDKNLNEVMALQMNSITNAQERVQESMVNGKSKIIRSKTS